MRHDQSILRYFNRVELPFEGRCMLIVGGQWSVVTGGFLIMLASHQAARAASPPEAYHTNPRNSLLTLGPLPTISNRQHVVFPSFFCPLHDSCRTIYIVTHSNAVIGQTQLSALVPRLLRLISLERAKHPNSELGSPYPRPLFLGSECGQLDIVSIGTSSSSHYLVPSSISFHHHDSTQQHLFAWSVLRS